MNSFFAFFPDADALLKKAPDEIAPDALTGLFDWTFAATASDRMAASGNTSPAPAPRISLSREKASLTRRWLRKDYPQIKASADPGQQSRSSEHRPCRIA